ncbi:TraU family protein [Helicobacter colisuis]|uniref:TraU family protein n=1 Tax=Helicobacter colisuis TaxID=2949739 RepID=A0ABT0TTX0_9HELI|nr:TraU family protein [Helicobacter colisuis]MCL9819355.1 TraU family protein [Helicobacter colisuis]
MKKVLSGFISLALSTQLAFAVCSVNPTQIITTLGSMCWNCIFPISIAGIPVINGPMPDSPTAVRSPICMCPAPPPLFYRIGFPIGYYEPSRSIDVNKDPYCFAGLGLNMGISLLQQGTKGDANTKDKTRTWFQSHYYIYSIFEMVGVFTDTMCLRGEQGIDIAYFTEVDPLWNDDSLSALINPEALLFGNPITNLACIADSVASVANSPLDTLFWCKGSWGNAYPLTGSTNTKNYVEDSASVASSMIYKLHRQLILWNSASYTALCGEHPLPIWIKTAYRLQFMYPFPHPMAMGIRQTGVIWTPLKNLPAGGDNFKAQDKLRGFSLINFNKT